MASLSLLLYCSSWNSTGYPSCPPQVWMLHPKSQTRWGSGRQCFVLDEQNLSWLSRRKYHFPWVKCARVPLFIAKSRSGVTLTTLELFGLFSTKTKSRSSHFQLTPNKVSFHHKPVHMCPHRKCLFFTGLISILYFDFLLNEDEKYSETFEMKQKKIGKCFK